MVPPWKKSSKPCHSDIHKLSENRFSFITIHLNRLCFWRRRIRKKNAFLGGHPPPGRPPSWKKMRLKYSFDSPLSEYTYFKQKWFTHMVQISSKKGLIWAKRGRKGGLSPPASLPGFFFLRLKPSVECPLSENMYFLQKKKFRKNGGQLPSLWVEGVPPWKFFFCPWQSAWHKLSEYI